jgi:hypothetical protein
MSETGESECFSQFRWSWKSLTAVDEDLPVNKVLLLNVARGSSESTTKEKKTRNETSRSRQSDGFVRTAADRSQASRRSERDWRTGLQETEKHGMRQHSSEEESELTGGARDHDHVEGRQHRGSAHPDVDEYSEHFGERAGRKHVAAQEGGSEPEANNWTLRSLTRALS